MAKTFGEFMRERRKIKEITLRSFCESINMDPSNYSRIERGVDKPPSNPARLIGMAQALGIPIESEEYKEMERLAAIDRGEIPRSILSDEELVSKLPVFFRTLEGSKIDDAALDKMIETVRKEFAAD